MKWIRFLSFLLLSLVLVVPINGNERKDTLPPVIQNALKLSGNDFGKNIKENLNLFKEAIELAKKIHSPYYENLLRARYSIILYLLGDYDVSLSEALIAIHFFEKNNYFKEAGDLYSEMGYQFKRRDLDVAFRWMRAGLMFYKKYGKDISLAAFYNNYGTLHFYKNNHDSAMYYYMLSVREAQKTNDSISVSYSYENIAGVYMAKNELEKAEENLKKSLEIRKRKNDLFGEAICLTNLGELYLLKNDFLKSIDYFKKSQIIAEKIFFTDLMRHNAENIAACYERIQKKDLAYPWLLLAKRLSDSLNNDAYAKNISFLQVKFETEKKEKELAENQAKLSHQELLIEKRNYLITGILLFTFIIIVVGIYIYKNQKQKQEQLIRENKLKDELTMVKVESELNQERLRISRELHDNIGSHLTFIVSLIDKAKGLNGENKNLDSLRDYTSEAIRQLRETIWTLKNEKITLSDLNYRILEFIHTARNSVQNTIHFEFESTSGYEGEINPKQGIHIFRIIQEAVNNAVRHANAKEILIKIFQQNEWVIFEVKDNGEGFDAEKAHSGNGLKNMKNRAEEAGLYFSVHSEPGNGTTVQVGLPTLKTSSKII
jgi:signal transduction histidine kinase